MIIGRWHRGWSAARSRSHGSTPSSNMTNGSSCKLLKSQRKVIGRGERIRTSDPLLPKQVRYQAALRPDYDNGLPAKGSARMAQAAREAACCSLNRLVQSNRSCTPGEAPSGWRQESLLLSLFLNQSPRLPAARGCNGVAARGATGSRRDTVRGETGRLCCPGRIEPDDGAESFGIRCGI